MLISISSIFRTIGGGQLEQIAIEKARVLLSKNESENAIFHIALGPEIGQCCGGRVELSIKKLDDSERQTLIQKFEKQLDELPKVYIFGAGHVGSALAENLSLLPVNPILIDTREDELGAAPDVVEKRLVAMPEAEIKTALPGSVFVILTHDHALDFLIAYEAMKRDDAAYIGMIGSKTKRATFQNWLARENGHSDDIERLKCPMGNPNISDKRPEIIAALISAEILEHLEHYSVRQKSATPDTAPTNV